MIGYRSSGRPDLTKIGLSTGCAKYIYKMNHDTAVDQVKNVLEAYVDCVKRKDCINTLP
jgi:hypothetical protein